MMSTAGILEGLWVARVDGNLFLVNFTGGLFELIFELPQGTSLSMGTYAVDDSQRPARIDLTLTDGIGKNGDRLKGRSVGSVVKGIVEHAGDTLKLFAPPPELDGRPTSFPNAEPGFVGPNLFLVLRRAA